jgi:hypothetical protein
MNRPWPIYIIVTALVQESEETPRSTFVRSGSKDSGPSEREVCRSMAEETKTENKSNTNRELKSKHCLNPVV